MNTEQDNPIQFPEPIVEEPAFETFISREEREYRWLKTSGADIAIFLIDLLRHGLRQAPSLSDIATTELYRRSNPAERRALIFACADNPTAELSNSDTEKFRRNDQMLSDFADKKLVGHREFENLVRSVPIKLEERRRFDEIIFPFAKMYASPRVFEWLLGERP